MIITYFGIIVFQLVEWMGILSKSEKADWSYRKDMLGFSYLAIPTRHTVHRKPFLHGDKWKISQNKPTKLLAVQNGYLKQIFCIHERW